jgi:nicotinamide-nucleotide amidase
MQTEIIAIGSEIISGRVVNTNAAYIAKLLEKFGYDIFRHSVVSDDEEAIKTLLKEALKRSSLIIVTGGLGATIDDKTKNIVANLLKMPSEYREDIAKDIEARFGSIESIEEQSNIPKNAIVFKNEIGTAPGLGFVFSGKAVLLLPGVAEEMKKMFSTYAMAFILEHFPKDEKKFHETINVYLISELKINSVLKGFEKNKDVEIGIYPSHGFVQIVLSTKEESEKKAKEKFAPIQKKLVSEFSENIFFSENGLIEETIQELFISKKKKLAVAESCTGGGLACRLTMVPGASSYFLGSIVSYVNEMKEKFLNVSEKTLKNKGAVSIDTVKEMIEGIFKQTDADFAIAISGIAGPGGGSVEKPIGMVCIAIGARKEKTDAGILYFKGNRKVIIDFAINYALSILHRRVCHNLFYFEP